MGKMPMPPPPRGRLADNGEIKNVENPVEVLVRVELNLYFSGFPSPEDANFCAEVFLHLFLDSLRVLVARRCGCAAGPRGRFFPRDQPLAFPDG